MRYVPMLTLILSIFCLWFKFNNPTRPLLQRLTLGSLGLYLVSLSYFCFTPAYLSTAAFAKMHPLWVGLAPLNLTPFAGGLGLDFFLNILMTVPLGLYYGLLAPSSRFKTSLILGLGIGLTLETYQFIADQVVDLKRWVDVNDLITNALGVCLGFLCFKLAAKYMPKLVAAFAVPSFNFN